MDAQTRVEHTLGARGADPGDGQGARRALRGRRAARRLPVRDARREPLARRAPRARRRAGRPARATSACRRGRSRGGCSTACASTRRTSARRPSSTGSRTCWSAATARTASSSSTRRTTTCARSCAEIVAASRADELSEPLGAYWTRIARGERARPLRRLQELQLRGVPVHHGVPVLRHAPAQARAEARARAARRSAARRRERAAAQPRCGRARSPASAPTGGPTRRSLLVLASVLVTLVLPGPASSTVDTSRRWSPTSPLDGDYWKLVTQLFVYWPRPATRSPRSARSSCSAGCWSAATARGRRCSCSSSAASAGVGRSCSRSTRTAARWAPTAPALALLAAWSMRDLLARRARRGGRRRPARRAGDRGRARAAAGRLAEPRLARRARRRRRRDPARAAARPPAASARRTRRSSRARRRRAGRRPSPPSSRPGTAASRPPEVIASHSSRRRGSGTSSAQVVNVSASRAVAPRAAGERVARRQQRRARRRSRAPRRRRPRPRRPLAAASSCRWPSSPKPVTSVSACAPAARACSARAVVERRHHLDRRARPAPASASPRLIAVATAPGAERLGQHERVARPAAGVGEHRVGVHGAGDREAVLRLGVVDRVAADDARARPRRRRRRRRAGSRASTSGPERLERERDEVERRHRHAAHRVDVATARWSRRCARTRTGRRRSA